MWSEEQDVVLKDTERLNMLKALQIAERKRKPGLDTMFEDIYDKKPALIAEQEQEMWEHIAKYPEEYTIES